MGCGASAAADVASIVPQEHIQSSPSRCNVLEPAQPHEATVVQQFEPLVEQDLLESSIISHDAGDLRDLIDAALTGEHALKPSSLTASTTDGVYKPPDAPVQTGFSSRTTSRPSSAIRLDQPTSEPHAPTPATTTAHTRGDFDTHPTPNPFDKPAVASAPSTLLSAYSPEKVSLHASQSLFEATPATTTPNTTTTTAAAAMSATASTVVSLNSPERDTSPARHTQGELAVVDVSPQNGSPGRSPKLPKKQPLQSHEKKHLSRLHNQRAQQKQNDDRSTVLAAQLTEAQVAASEAQSKVALLEARLASENEQHERERSELLERLAEVEKQLKSSATKTSVATSTSATPTAMSDEPIPMDAKRSLNFSSPREHDAPDHQPSTSAIRDAVSGVRSRPSSRSKSSAKIKSPEKQHHRRRRHSNDGEGSTSRRASNTEPHHPDTDSADDATTTTLVPPTTVAPSASKPPAIPLSTVEAIPLNTTAAIPSSTTEAIPSNTAEAIRSKTAAAIPSSTTEAIPSSKSTPSAMLSKPPANPSSTAATVPSALPSAKPSSATPGTIPPLSSEPIPEAKPSSAPPGAVPSSTIGGIAVATPSVLLGGAVPSTAIASGITGRTNEVDDAPHVAPELGTVTLDPNIPPTDVPSNFVTSTYSRAHAALLDTPGIPPSVPAPTRASSFSTASKGLPSNSDKLPRSQIPVPRRRSLDGNNKGTEGDSEVWATASPARPKQDIKPRARAFKGGKEIRQVQEKPSVKAGDAAGVGVSSRSVTNEGEALSVAKIVVVVRKRPLLPKELNAGEVDILAVNKQAQMIVHAAKSKLDLRQYVETYSFNFDAIFDHDVSNEQVYKQTAATLVECMFNEGKATCFAYGQTGSGKTHTMIGDAKSPGLYALAAEDVFATLDKPIYTFLHVEVSFFEIYRGKLFDLLNDRCRLITRNDAKQNLNVVGLTEVPVSSCKELIATISRGNKARSTAATGANLDSSRSHALLVFALKSATGDTHGKFSFVDLAGSERASDTLDNDRQTRIEGAEINKSLLALKECIRSLGKDKTHIPFRGSKLTEVLKDAFVGNSRTIMIANVAPGSACCEHTMNTLRYANRVKELKPIARRPSSAADADALRSPNDDDEAMPTTAPSPSPTKQLGLVQPLACLRAPLHPFPEEDGDRPLTAVEELRKTHAKLVEHLLSAEEEIVLAHREQVGACNAEPELALVDQRENRKISVDEYVRQLDQLLQEKEKAIKGFQDSLHVFKSRLGEEEIMLQSISSNSDVLSQMKAAADSLNKDPPAKGGDGDSGTD